MAGDSFAQRAAQLTPQQWRVLALMVQGDQNKQIAHKLGVGEATVKAHVTVILRKLGVRLETANGPLFPEREFKTPAEAAAIREGNRLSSIGFTVSRMMPSSLSISCRRIADWRASGVSRLAALFISVRPSASTTPRGQPPVTPGCSPSPPPW